MIAAEKVFVDWYRSTSPDDSWVEIPASLVRAANRLDSSSPQVRTKAGVSKMGDSALRNWIVLELSCCPWLSDWPPKPLRAIRDPYTYAPYIDLVLDSGHFEPWSFCRSWIHHGLVVG